MALKLSTGLRNSILVTGSAKARMDGKVLKIFAGAAPATADAELGAAVLLCTITNDATATALTFDPTPVNAVMFKAPTEIWRGVNSAAGNATFYRLEDAADVGDASTTAERVQGTVSAGGGGDLNLSSVALVAGASQGIDFYSIELPTA